MEPVIPLLSQESAAAAGEAAGVPPVLSRLHVFRALLHRPALAGGISSLLLSLLAGGALDRRLRELAIMRIAWERACGYEWAQHWRIALDAGVPEDELLAMRDGRPIGEPADLVLRATAECLGDGRVAATTMAELGEHLGTEATVELLGVIGAWDMVAMLLRSMEVPFDDDLATWPPDGRAPAPDSSAPDSL